MTAHIPTEAVQVTLSGTWQPDSDEVFRRLDGKITGIEILDAYRPLFRDYFVITYRNIHRLEKLEVLDRILALLRGIEKSPSAIVGKVADYGKSIATRLFIVGAIAWIAYKKLL